ncbi:hypothetical protein ABC304_17895 [Microbacterium sp. 1P10UB]|uniref:hypothetical protein n=1 Tax=unclassified Microbacterium TaxID=2609290 RepID=UPI00399EEDF6
MTGFIERPAVQARHRFRPGGRVDELGDPGGVGEVSGDVGESRILGQMPPDTRADLLEVVTASGLIEIVRAVVMDDDVRTQGCDVHRDGEPVPARRETPVTRAVLPRSGRDEDMRGSTAERLALRV